MKTLVDEISGRKDLPIFKGSNEGIRNWVELHIDQLEQLREPHSCEVLLDEDSIIISGDEDLREFRIVEVNAIDVE
jgi:hypothetical protein